MHLPKSCPHSQRALAGGKLNEFLLKVLVMCVQPIDQSSCYELSSSDWAAMLKHCNIAPCTGISISLEVSVLVSVLVRM